MAVRATPKEFFQAQEVTFSVGSSPVVGVPFKVDSVQKVTPYMESILPDVKMIEAYPSVVVAGRLYVFQMWDDGETALKRTADLTVKTNYLMVYLPAQEAPAVQAFQPNHTPVVIVALVVLGIVAICFFAYLSSRR